jgi:hypothetical protein
MSIYYKLLSFGAFIVLLSCSPPKGEVGPKGLQGIQGPAGDPGANGPTGVQGDQGIKGLTGEKGDQGPKGADGDLNKYSTGWVSAEWKMNENQTEIQYTYLDQNLNVDWLFNSWNQLYINSKRLTVPLKMTNRIDQYYRSIGQSGYYISTRKDVGKISISLQQLSGRVIPISVIDSLIEDDLKLHFTAIRN